jgi:hypothetical protein
LSSITPNGYFRQKFTKWLGLSQKVKQTLSKNKNTINLMNYQSILSGINDGIIPNFIRNNEIIKSILSSSLIFITKTNINK